MDTGKLLYTVDYSFSLEDLVKLVIPSGPEQERSLKQVSQYAESESNRRWTDIELVEAHIITLGVHMNEQLVKSRITQTGTRPNVWELLSLAAVDPTAGCIGGGLIAFGSECSSFDHETSTTLSFVPCLVQFGTRPRELVSVAKSQTFGPSDQFLIVSKRTPQ